MKQFNLKIRKKISQLLHSIASNLEPQDRERVEGLEKQPTHSSRGKLKLPKLKIPTLQPKIPKFVVIPSYVKKLYQRYPLHHHPKFWLGMGITLGIGTGAVAVGWNIYRIETSLPQSVDEILTYAPEGSLTIQAADGTILQQVGDIPYEHLKLWQFPDYALQAFIAIEDRRFQDHHGVDFQGIFRAIVSNLLARDVVEGGSTITQQLARMVFLSQERSFGRKIKEMRVAGKIEEQFDKAEILESYLNFVYLGSGAYGVADAAWIYFSKPVEKLTLPEAATLAGIVPAPSLYSPLQNQKMAKQRRDLVLERMHEEGYITQQEATEAIASPLALNPSPPKRLQRQAPYFTEYIQKELPKYVSKEVLQRGGLIVETTLNSKWQQAAKETVDTAVSRYGRWQRFEQAALVAIDPRNGQIKAMVGGNDFEKNQYNRVTQAKRQPGSTFKTFVYSTAIAAGFSPNQGFLDAEYFVDGYKPENYGDSYSGNYVSMRNALTKSLNVVAVKALVDVGWNPIIRIAKRMGIQSELKPTYSLALGASEVNLLEITSGYGTLANRGVHQQPYGISRIIDRNGKILYQANFKPVKAIDEGTSGIMTWMLQGVVTGGTGQAAQIGRPVAGKTGTSDKARDLWFIGYIPQLVTGIWLGNDDNQPTWGASTTSAALWRQFMLNVVEDMPIVSFPPLPKLEGRKGSIKAEPIKPKNSYYQMPQTQPKEEAQTTTNQTEQPTYRRRRRRSRDQAYNYNNYNRQPVQYSSAPVRAYSYRRRTARSSVNSAPAPAPAPASVPIPVNQPVVQSVRQSLPVSAPVTNIAPPAPPATHKEE